MQGRCIGLDVHRDFCEVAIWQDGDVRRAPQVPARPEPLTQFAEQLGPADRVALESTSNALAIARIIRPHVAQVVIVNTRRLKAIPTELPSGVVSMGVRSYVPQIGRFLQPDPAPGGSANAYAYTFGDPINSTDPTGAYVEGSFLAEVNNAEDKEIVARAEHEAAARIAAEQAAREAAAAAATAGPQYAGGEEEYAEEWEEWEEEEGGGGYEYTAYHHGAKPASEAHHVEPAILVQRLNREATDSEGTTALGSVTPLCKAGSEGSCSSDVIAGSPCIPSGCHGKRRGSYHVPSWVVRCAVGGGSYGFVGYLIDAVKLTPEGALASCALSVLAG
jgi:RHS repeat-associated protein